MGALWGFKQQSQCWQMRPETSDDINPNIHSPEHADIIRETRKMIRGMSEVERFQKAEKHVHDALSYRRPRPDTFSSELSEGFKVIYAVQTSSYWDLWLLTLSYVFMYLVILDNHYFIAVASLETFILMILWVDIIMEAYHKSFEEFCLSSKFETRFYIKIAVICCLSLDLIVWASLQEVVERQVRPFRILRAILPILYDALVRKSFEALLSAYKDIMVYILFYSLLILGFAVVGNQIIELPEGTKVDNFSENYKALDKMIFIMYVLSTYDAYPDNEIQAIRSSIYLYGFFIVFIFLNVFLFVTIPTTVIFNSYRETRSKTILVDQIRQKHSLILAFVSLGEDNFNISIEKLTKFLLFMYKNKVRYIDYITEICLRLDENNNGFIQVNEFMQLCKVLQANNSMMPPNFPDSKIWINFRKYLNERLYFKALLASWCFKFTINIIVVFTFINACLCIYTDIKAFRVIDNIFMGIFILEMIVKIIGFGPENFFRDKWNSLDLAVILIGLFLEMTPKGVRPHNSDILFKMTRIFRVVTLIKLFTNDPKLKLKSSIYRKIRQLLGQTAVITPIVTKFLPLYLISYYILGILGMEIFYDSDMKPSESPYNGYDQFSNFRTFIGSQFIFTQVLVEAGWSMIAYDHAQRNGYFAFVMMYFVTCHIIIVIILSSLLKGIVWEVYFTIDHEFQEKLHEQIFIQNKEDAKRRKKEEFEEIKAKIDQKEFFSPDTVIKRDLYENKMDIELFKKLKELYLHKDINPGNRSKQRTVIISHLIADRQILMDEIQLQQDSEENQSTHGLYERIVKKNFQDINELEVEVIEEEDFEEEMEKMLSRLILNPKIKFSEAVVYPKVFVDYLQSKLIKPLEVHSLNGFNLDTDPIANKESVKFHTYEMNVLLQIEKSSREQKIIIIKNLINNGIISEDDASQLFSKKLVDKSYNINVNWVMRKICLNETNQHLIKKFQVEYFSGIYGQSFREINKVTIEPLLRYEATLTYSLRNILRYPQINTLEFFRMLTTIENSFSSRLLKRGSLLKFVYQIDSFSDNWFTIQFTDSGETKVHFIKTGIWIYHKGMVEGEMNYGRDIFNLEALNRSDKASCEKFLKLCFQSFESLAFGLVDQEAFFASNPVYNIYVLYSFFIRTKNTERFARQQLEISKVMLVILSKEEERPPQSRLSYELSDISVARNTRKKDINFKLDETEKETLKKLKKLSILDHEKIVESEGLPFTYILNLMRELLDVLKLYSPSLINHVEKVLNNEFNEI